MPIDTPSRLEDLLIDPREGLDVEFKNWLDLDSDEHKAVLAKALMAIANHGGGFVVIGFDETGATQDQLRLGMPATVHLDLNQQTPPK